MEPVTGPRKNMSRNKASAVRIHGNQCLNALLSWMFFLFARTCSSNSENIVNERNVFGGEPIEDEEYRWFCAVRRRKDLSFVCSASLVGSRFVITTQGCIENEDSALEVEVGYLCRSRDNCDRDNEFVDVEKVFRHTDGDMALLVLKRRIDIDVMPAVPYLGPLFNRDVKPLGKGRRMKLVGVGRMQGRNGGISPRVRKLSVRSIKGKLCSKRLKNPELVTKATTCSVAMDDNSCGVDGGGPLIVPGTGEWKDRDVLMAIHSFGHRRCSTSKRTHPMGHFNLIYGADLLREVVCKGNYGPPEDWCERPPPKVELLHTLPRAHGRNVYSVSFNKDGSDLVSGGTGTFADGDINSGTVLLWNPREGGSPLAKGSKQDYGWVDKVAFHPTDNSLIVSTTFDGELNLWTIDESEKLSLTETLIEADPDGCCSSRLVVAWNPADGTLVSTPRGTSIIVWNVLPQKKKEKTVSLEAGGKVRSLAFNSAGTLLASSGDDNTIRIWRTDKYALVNTLGASAAFTCAMSFSPCDKYLAAACENDNGAIRIWEVESGQRLRNLAGQPRALTLAWSPDSRYIVSGGGFSERTLRVFDVTKGGSPVVIADTENSVVHDVAWSPDGGQIAAAMDNAGGLAQIKIWSVQT